MKLRDWFDWTPGFKVAMAVLFILTVFFVASIL